MEYVEHSIIKRQEYVGKLLVIRREVYTTHSCSNKAG